MIGVMGAGFLGHKVVAGLTDAEFVRVDIADSEAVRRVISSGRYSAIVNAAGKTGKPNVDWCETHQTETFRSNVIGPLVLAQHCADAGTYLLHFGSGCIFYGPSPRGDGWRETDHANPSAYYSRTKYAADLVLAPLANTAVVRIRMPIDSTPAPRNLITKLAGYREVIDVENSVTVIEDLIGVVDGLIRKRATGIFHATNPGSMRHRDLLALYAKWVVPGHTYSLIREEELVVRGLALRARSNCLLASTNLADVGLSMRPIEIALEDAMKKYARTM